MRNFFILGNGHSGSSLLQGLLNAHSKMLVEFENFGDKPSEQFTKWENKSNFTNAQGLAYGNKIPIEQFKSRRWTDKDIIKIAEKYYVLWLQRRFSRYNEAHNNTKQTEEYRANWDWGRSLYWKLKEDYPSRVIEVSFEDILFQPRVELYRICCFLNVKYEGGMLLGCQHTGYKKYNQPTINQERI